MQVLVVLAQASPAVVSRGDLNRLVWGGRIVGEDAINRALQMLRRIAADAPPPAPFAIETIPRVGYRLTRDEQVAPAATSKLGLDPDAFEAGAFAPSGRTRPDDTPRRRGLSWAVAGLTGVVATLALWGLVRRDVDSATWRIAGSATFDQIPPGATDVALSPDGTRLAYRSRDLRGRERIYVRAAENDGPGTPISPDDRDARHPTWSPNGTSLAFATFDTARPCRLYVLRAAKTASPVGTCETTRDPHVAWSADGHALLFGDAPGWNAVPRVTSVNVTDGQRMVLSSPPGDSMGDDLPAPLGKEIAFRRQFTFGDEGWIARDPDTGRERVLWRRRGVVDSVAAALPDDTLAIAWTKAGASALDFVDADKRVTSQQLPSGPVTAISNAGMRLLIEIDRSESALARASNAASSATTLATVRGKVRIPIMLPDGGVRFPVISAGVARMWELSRGGSLRPWGTFAASNIGGPALSPDGRRTAALVIEKVGREIILFDAGGTPIYRWNPPSRALNPAAWSGDGRHLIVPVLDGAGWRLFELDPFKGASPRDIGLPGFATVLGQGKALYAIRAGETTDIRELWRLDGRIRRLPIDLTLFDIMNWRPVTNGIWLPDRRAANHPRLVLRDIYTGRVLRSLAAPGLAGPSSGLAADTSDPIYIKVTRDEPENMLLILARERAPSLHRKI